MADEYFINWTQGLADDRVESSQPEEELPPLRQAVTSSCVDCKIKMRLVELFTMHKQKCLFFVSWLGEKYRILLAQVMV